MGHFEIQYSVGELMLSVLTYHREDWEYDSKALDFVSQANRLWTERAYDCNHHSVIIKPKRTANLCHLRGNSKAESDYCEDSEYDSNTADKPRSILWNDSTLIFGVFFGGCYN